MNMRKAISAALAASVIAAYSGFAAGEHRIGAGANYWVTLDDLDVDDIDDSGFSYLVTYQYRDGLWGLELNAEFLPDRFGENAWAPEAYLIFGDSIYAAAGIGIVHTDGDFESSPFYALRAGFDLEIFSGLHLDISANYRFNDTADLSDSDTRIDTDTVFLGAALRLAL
ncbi:MAG: hypothetical protein ACLFRP_09220 [Puniceicoccaceae bacterium]